MANTATRTSSRTHLPKRAGCSRIATISPRCAPRCANNPSSDGAMKALVLSAGYGERLRPLTDQVPKPLLDVGGRPLIHYPLLMLRAAGIRDVAINVHHLG